MKNNIIIVGYFPTKLQSPVTQASELGKLLNEKGYQIIKVSKYANKWMRAIDIISRLILSRNKYNIAIVQFYSGNSFVWQYAASKLVKVLGKKLAFTIHGGGVPDRIKVLPQRYLPLLKSADAITVPSMYLKNVLDGYGIKSILIENTIPLKQYSFNHKTSIKPVLLWMRAFSSIYNPLMAVRVVSELKKKIPTVKMYMGGQDLGLLSETKKLIEQLNLKDNIEILGFLSMPDKKKYGEKCDIYISTNKIDNAPVTFLEMWAMGLPIVSTNVGGVSNLIDENINGLLVCDNDYISMAKKITDVIEHKSLANRLTTNGREKVKLYDEEVVYYKWASLLDKL